MEYVLNLQFEQKPDYKLLITMFQNLLVKSNYDLDDVYDWNILQVGGIRALYFYNLYHDFFYW